MSYTNRLKLPFIHTGQAQKEITHNEALNLLDVLVNPVIQEINIIALPDTSKLGQLYIIAQNPKSEFTKHSNKIAQRLENSWRYITPPKWLEVTLDKDGSKYRFNGNTWQELENTNNTSIPPSTFPIIPPIQNDYLIKKDSGEYLQVLHLEEELKLSGNYTDTTIKIPHHTIVIAVNIRVLEEITGATSFSIGVADDPIRYGNNLNTAEDTTNIGLTNHPLTYWNDTSIRLTTNEADFTDGLVKVTIQLLKPHGPWNWE